MRILSISSAILVVSGLSILAFAEGPGTGREESVDMEEKYPEVLLEDVVKEFDYLIGRIGHHAIAVGDEVYIQPHVYLSFHVIQMRAAGWDTDFDEVAAVSGASALFAYEHGTFDPKYAHHLIDMDERITEATGFGYEWVRFKGINEAWAIVKESVDSGRSVKGWFWENIMFAGYQDADKTEDRKVFAMADGPGTFAEWWSWEKFGKEYVDLVTGWGATGLGRHTERVATKPANEVALRIIKDLVEWSTNPPEQILKKYPKATFGLAGIELYAKNCADMEKFEDFGACHDINPQWPIRNSTSIYLKKVTEAKVFSEEINFQLLKAAEEYKAAYVYWKQFYDHLSYGGWEGWGKVKEHRMAGAEGIQKALEHEKLAIESLKTFLELVYAKPVIISGVDQYQVCEPMFESVRIVLYHRGENYSPAYIQGISGAAFRIAGPCPCAPTCSTAMSPQELLNLLGYEFKHLDLSAKGVDPEKEVYNIVPKVKEEIRAGNPVMVWHAFTNAEWDVVCGFDEVKKQFFGYGSYRGSKDNLATESETRMVRAMEICPAYGAIIVGEKIHEFNAREAELAALEEAVRHGNSPRDRFLDEADGLQKPWRFREGLACYDVWIDNFSVNPDKVPGAGDRYCLGWVGSTHGAAGEFMREIAPKYPEVKEYFLQAAEYFDADTKALIELRDKVFEWWSGYKEADPEKARRAVELLTESRKNYAQAIGEIEKALKEIAPERADRAKQVARIQRENGSVLIRNIQKLNWESGKDCTSAGATAEAMRVTEHPYIYNEIMGLTGLAFRVRWCDEDTKTKWCCSAPIGEMPDEQTALTKLTGWELPSEWLNVKGRDNESLRKKIVASIDAGKPVVAYPQHWNMALIYGYEDDGKILLINDYMSKEFPSRLPVEELGRLYTYLGDYGNPPSLRDGLKEALQTAVNNWKRERHHGGLADREYWYGDAAFKAWISDIQKYDEFPEETRKSLMILDPWNYTSLYDAREAAVGFLKDWSILLGGDSRQALENAAKLYEEEVKTLEKLLANKRSDGKDWSKEARTQEIEVLTKARELESKAIGQMEEALR